MFPALYVLRDNLKIKQIQQHKLFGYLAILNSAIFFVVVVGKETGSKKTRRIELIIQHTMI
jgi:uncharacterized membrane protein YsdA (DUF1294 family)